MKLKGLERRWKAVAIGAICRALARRSPPGPPPDWSSQPGRILFLRQDRIGDAIVSSGLLRALGNVAPTLAVDVLASPTNAAILARDPHVGAVHVYDKRRPGSFVALARRLRAARYDAVIDCMVTAPSMTGLMLMLATGARHRIGIAGRGVDAALTLPVRPAADAVHIIDLMAAFALPFGIDPATTEWRPWLPLTSREREGAMRRWEMAAGAAGGHRLLVNVSAGKPDRTWPADRFVEVIRHLQTRFPELTIGVVGGPAERERLQAIADAAGVAAIETPTIVDLIALVATADCVFTPDTSVTHMASAFRVPALVLFQDAAIAAQWGLYRSPGTNLIGDVSALADLPTAAVIPELERILGAVASSPISPTQPAGKPR